VINDGLNEFRDKRLLILQGPVGPFFARLATDLALAGATVFKVNFNAGDWVFAPRDSYSRVFNFTGHARDWPAYLTDLLLRLNIDTLLLFGDCRALHVVALDICRIRGIQTGVFEEGYLRPDFITLERDGVNNNSSLPSDPRFYLGQLPQHVPDNIPLGSTYGQAAKWGMLYFAAASLGRPWFRHYQHHRRLGISDGPSWVVSFWRKHRCRVSERALLPLLTGEKSGKFFLASLQMRGDAQMAVHSGFDSVEAFIEHVIGSFAKHAPADCVLALKHHPLDRGYSDYSLLIRRMAQQFGVSDRCFYLHDQHLPTLLRHARGVVVVNSTVGLSAVGEGVPVKLCGYSIYDVQGLTYQGNLDTFWMHAHLATPNPALYQAFRNYLISHTQHQGSFYKRLPGVSFQSGVAWADHGAKPPHHGVDEDQRARLWRLSDFQRRQQGGP